MTEEIPAKALATFATSLLSRAYKIFLTRATIYLLFTTFYIHSKDHVANTPLNLCLNSSLSSLQTTYPQSIPLNLLSFSRGPSLSVTRTTVTMPEGEVVQAKKSFMGMPGFVVDFLSKSSDIQAFATQEPRCLRLIHTQIFN